MPLQDHFHPPLSNRRHWHSFHHAWATYISSDLNQRLPRGYFAEANVQFGIEVDVASFQEQGPPAKNAALPWTPPAPVLTLPFPLVTDIIEIQVFNESGGPVLAGAIELVSPANKDREAHRDAFVSKCETLLRQGVGLVIVDVVTTRQANLHDALSARLFGGDAVLIRNDLYSVAYHPVVRDGETKLDIWPHSLAVEKPLPTLPLCLLGGLCVPLDLEATYERTRLEQRVDATDGL